MLNLPDLSRLTNDPVSHNLAWPPVPNKLPSDIPEFEGKPREDLSEHVMLEQGPAATEEAASLAER